MAARKNTQTFPYCNYDNKKKSNPPWPPIVIMTTPKKDSYWIPFIVDVINDCYNNLRVVKGRRQEQKD